MFSKIKEIYSLNQIRRICTEAHGCQGYGMTKTKGGEGLDGFHEFSYHLRRVENIAISYGFGDDTSIRKACWGHDVLEDTCLSKENLLACGFSAYEVALIDAVTDGKAETRHERKLEAYRKIKLLPCAVVIKLSDRIANVWHALCASEDLKYFQYFNEHDEFCLHLRQCLEDDARVQNMWAHLDYLFSDAACKKWHGTLNCCSNYKEVLK